jgi:bacteriorhodopsin
MASKATNNKTMIDLLYEYINKRFDIQDSYFDSCYKGLRNMTMWLWIIVFACWAINNFALIHEFGKLEHRVQTIEQTWSE